MKPCTFLLLLGPGVLPAEPGDNLECSNSWQERVKRVKKKKNDVKVWLEKAAKYEVFIQGQLGHIQVPQGTLEAGDCDRGAN